MTDRVDVLRGVLKAEYELGQVSVYNLEVIDPPASDSSFAGGARYSVAVSRCPSWTLRKIREAGFRITALNERGSSPSVQLYLEDLKDQEESGEEPYLTPEDVPQDIIEDVAAEYEVGTGDVVRELWGHPDNTKAGRVTTAAEDAAVEARDRYRRSGGDS